MGLTPTTNQVSLIQRCKISGLFGVVGYGYVRKLLWELILIIDGRYLIIGLRQITELSEQIVCFNDNFSTDTGTPKNNTPLLDEVYNGETVYNLRALHFYTSNYRSKEVRTISDLTFNSASSSAYTLVASTIVYQNNDVK